jgi:protein-tyrosine phosphatase
MDKFTHIIHKGVDIIRRRIREQGIGTTLLWAFARSVPAITGVPILRFSRISSQLYVGSQFRKNGLKVLRNNGINAVVNLRKEFDDAAYGIAPADYCYLPTVDDTAPTMDQLSEGINFIQRIISSGGKVYIHCSAGVGRAPTLAAAYLITTGLSLDEAIATLRHARPFIYIMPPQINQLKKLEQNFQKLSADFPDNSFAR